MSDWSAGYVADIEYLPGFYREQAPAHLALTCLVNGIAPPEMSDRFTYCELGCGTGQTVSLLAAANPNAEFHAVDFHPAHIARAREFAEMAGLSNIRFHETDFETIADGRGPDMPMFDAVTLHGVYSWVSPANRRAIVRFLDRHMNPGGVVYVSYNAQPGWTPLMPLQRLLYEYAGLAPDRSDRRVAAGLDFAKRMRGAGARVLGDDETLDKLRGETKTQGERDQLVYLAHEYLNGSWQPLYHMDVAREMAEAKMVFAGSATVFENYPDLALTPEQRAVLETVPVPTLKETFKDYLTNRPFRRDVYVRGARRLTTGERDRRLGEIKLALTVPREEARTAIKVPLGEAELEKRHYEPMFDALAEGPLSIAALIDLPAVKAAGGALSPGEVAGMMIGSQQAIPILPGGPAADASGTSGGALAGVVSFNRAQVVDATRTVRRRTSSLAASVGGSGLHATMVEVLLYDGLMNGIDPADVPKLADHALSRILGVGESLIRDGEMLEGADANRAAIADSLDWCVKHSVPIWKRLGMI